MLIIWIQPGRLGSQSDRDHVRHSSSPHCPYNYCRNVTKMSICLLMYIVCKPMDIHGYPYIRWVWTWSDIYAHGYFRGRGKVRLMDLDLDLVLQYPSKPAPLPSLVSSASSASSDEDERDLELGHQFSRVEYECAHTRKR
jgi:hypothetical protein